MTGCHLLPANGSRAKNWTYCTKDGVNIETNFEIADKPVVPYVEPLPSPYPWQKSLLDALEMEPNRRTIHWIWDAVGGCGKTTFTKHVATALDAVLLMPPKTADAKHAVAKYFDLKKSTPRVCISNIPRDAEDYLSYGGLETIKDMCFCSGKYEGCQIVGPCPHLVIFANFPPKYDKMSRDRWIVWEVDHNKEIIE